MEGFLFSLISRQLSPGLDLLSPVFFRGFPSLRAALAGGGSESRAGMGFPCAEARTRGMKDRNVPTPLHFPPNSSKALPKLLPSQAVEEITRGTETFRGCPHEGARPGFGGEGVGLGWSWGPHVLSPPSPPVLLPPARACHLLLHLGTRRWLSVLARLSSISRAVDAAQKGHPSPAGTTAPPALPSTQAGLYFPLCFPWI